MRFPHALMTALALISIVSCSRRTEWNRQLDDVASYIEIRPDSALTVLRAMVLDDSVDKRSRAYYSLLHSMALDKNYIDLTTDSIIAPAISYYKKSGSDDQRMKAFYYLGRIYSNKGDHDSAMQAYVSAERYVSGCDDKLAIGRLYRAKMQVSKFLYDLDGQLEAAKAASGYYLEAGDSSRYFGSISDMASVYLQMKEDTSAISCLNILKSNWDKLNMTQRSVYYALALHLNSDDSVLLYEYLEKIQDAYVHWMIVAHVYCRLEEYQKALEALDNYKNHNKTLGANYYWRLAEVCQKLGDYEKASLAYREYSVLSDSIDLQIFDSDAKFIEERFAHTYKSLKRRNTIIILTLILIILVLSVALLIELLKSSQKKRREESSLFEAERKQLLLKLEEYEILYNKAVAEKERLSSIQSNSKIDRPLREVIDERLRVLNGFIAANISDNFRMEANAKLSRYMQDRDCFLESTAKTFTAIHPKFMRYLKKSALDDREIGICCLYCIGLNGADISNYLDSSMLYKTNVVIRKKLDVPRSVNIDRFLREKLAGFSI